MRRREDNSRNVVSLEGASPPGRKEAYPPIVGGPSVKVPHPRVLFLAASPDDETRIRLDREYREVQEAFKRTRDDFGLQHQPAVRTLDLSRALQEYQPNIVHFCGHGTGADGLVMENDRGESHLVRADALAELFERFADRVVCVVLNACYSEEQAIAISEHIRYVIGMHSLVPDSAAIKFATAFYDLIAVGESITTAFKNARAVLGMELDESVPMATLLQRKVVAPEESPQGGRDGPRTDWREAPKVSALYGRSEELETLRTWILEDRCSVVLVVGIGGVGKSQLSVKLGRGGIGKTDLSRQCAGALEENFDFVIWKRLLNAPPPDQIVTECIRFILGDGEYSLPRSFEGRVSTLLTLFQDHRCLLVLDNIEAVLEGGKSAIRYRGGFEGYGELLRAMGEIEHRSCLILTSREKPPEVARMEGPTRAVRTLALGGLSTADGRKVVADLGTFEATDKDWEDLVDLYNGNPLALELAAHHIFDAHHGNVRAFLGTDRPIFGDLRELLDWHLARLSPQEREVMYWLAIEREAVSISQLGDDLLSPISRQDLPTTIQALQRRLPIERQGPSFSLQPVLMEYMTESLVTLVGEEVQIGDSRILSHFTEDLVDQVRDELIDGRLDLFNAHSLLKATSKDYVRSSQSRVIVQPLVERLLARYGHREAVEAVLFSIVDGLRRERPLQLGYAVGNILDILSELRTDLTGADFSRCTVWQAYLQAVELHDVDFSDAQFRHVTFRSDFAQLMCVATSSDGSLVAAGDTLNVLRVWSLPDLKPVSVCLGHGGWVSCVAFSPNGEYLVSCGYDHTCRLWNPETGACLATLEGHSNWVTCIAVSSDGRWIATASEDGEARMWDAASGTYLRTLVKIEDGWMGAVAFDPQGRWVASIGSDGVLRLTGLNDGWSDASFQLEGAYRTLKCLGDGRQLALVSQSGKILIVGVPDLTVHRTIEGGFEVRRVIEAHPGGAWCIAASPDGRWLASSGNDSQIRIWHLPSGEFVRSLEGHQARVYSVTFQPDSSSLVSVGADQTIRTWNVDRGSSMRTLRGYTNVLWSNRYLPDGERVATVGDDGVIRVWDGGTGACQAKLGSGDRLWTVAAHPNGKLIAAAGDDLAIRIWRIRDGLCVHTCNGHVGWVRGLDFHPTGSMLASAAEDWTVRIWDPKTGVCLETLEGHADRALSAAFSPDGRYLASGGEDGAALVWDLERKAYAARFTDHEDKVHEVAFTHDSSRLVTCAEDSKVRVWELRSSSCIATLEGHLSKIWAVACSPRGDLIASGGEEGLIILWDAETLTRAGCLRGHETRIWSLSFASDGSRLASTSDDGTLRIWDLDTHRAERVVRPKRPYEGMCLSNVRGLDPSEILVLERLGART